MCVSRQWITKVETTKDTYTVVLEEQLADHVSKQVRLTGRCPVKCEDGTVKTIYASKNEAVALLDLFLHGVNADLPIDVGLRILCGCVENSQNCDPTGVYSIDAHASKVGARLAYYDAGVVVAFTSEGFVANVSTKTASSKDRVNKLSWLTGCPPGGILCRAAMRVE